MSGMFRIKNSDIKVSWSMLRVMAHLVRMGGSMSFRDMMKSGLTKDSEQVRRNVWYLASKGLCSVRVVDGVKVIELTDFGKRLSNRFYECIDAPVD